MVEKKSGIFGFGILGGNRPQLLGKIAPSKQAPSNDAQQAQTREFCRLLDAAILDEENADPEYAKLADELYKSHLPIYIPAGTSSQLVYDHAAIIGIRNQEIGHKKILEGIKARYCTPELPGWKKLKDHAFRQGK